MAFIICVAALIIMMFVFTKMLLSFGNNSSAAVESVDATVVEKKQGIYNLIYPVTFFAIFGTSYVVLAGVCPSHLLLPCF